MSTFGYNHHVRPEMVLISQNKLGNSCVCGTLQGAVSNAVSSDEDYVRILFGTERNHSPGIVYDFEWSQFRDLGPRGLMSLNSWITVDHFNFSISD